MITMYDVLIGIFRFFPKGKTDFKYDRYKIAEFIVKNREKYPILSDFREGDVIDTLETMDVARMVREVPLELTRPVRTIDPTGVRHSFYTQNTLRFRLSDLDQVKDLSRKFVEKFG